MMELLSGECDRQTVMKNMCADCGADLEQDMSIVPSANKPNRSQISIVHSIPELKISSNVSLTCFHIFISYSPDPTNNCETTNPELFNQSDCF